jgi:ERF superfamily protein
MTQSENLNELFAALAKAQAEYTVADKSKDNPFFKSKYASYDSLVGATRPALTKYGLAIITRTRIEDGEQYLQMILSHSSGQYIASESKINPSKTDIQALGSYRTYLLRYGYKELTGVVTQDEDEDDDGEAAMVRHQNYSNMSSDTITKEQIDIINEELAGEYEIKDDMFKKLGITSLGQIKKSQFPGILKRIRDIKGIK